MIPKSRAICDKASKVEEVRQVVDNHKQDGMVSYE